MQAKLHEVRAQALAAGVPAEDVEAALVRPKMLPTPQVRTVINLLKQDLIRRK